MSRQINIILISITILTLGEVIWVACLPGVPDPLYEGRRLSAWLSDFGVMIDDNWVPVTRDDPYPSPAVRAILEVGTNALPYLAKQLASRRSKMAVRVEGCINDLGWKIGFKSEIIRHKYSDDELYWMALRGLEALGPKAKPCLPDLIAFIRRAEAKDKYDYWGLGRQAKMTSYQLAPDSEMFQSREAKISVLADMVYFGRAAARQSALEALAQMGEATKAEWYAAEAIRGALTDRALQVRIAATNALANFVKPN